MNVGKAFIELNDANVEKIARQGAGVYKIKEIQEITFVYRLTDLYMVGWLNNGIFYSDKNEIDENETVLDSSIASALSISGVAKIKSVRFGFRYIRLENMENIETHWAVVEKLLKSKKLDEAWRCIDSYINIRVLEVLSNKKCM